MTSPNRDNPNYYPLAVQHLFNPAPHQPKLPLRRFQNTILSAASLYPVLLTQAPSQSGKSVTIAAWLATRALRIPRGLHLIFSATEDQAIRILNSVRYDYISNARDPRFRELETDAKTEIKLKANQAQIIALPHSIRALTGNPADSIALDEMAKWDRDPHLFYAETIARTGDTQGCILGVSTFFGQGRPDPKSETGYSGNFYNYQFNQIRNHPDTYPTSGALSLTYKINPKWYNPVTRQPTPQLLHLKQSMDPEIFREHYEGQPRKAPGTSVFKPFWRDEHLKPEREVRARINPDYTLFFSMDPGLNKAIVVGQFDPDTLTTLVLKEYLGTRNEQSMADFIRTAWLKTAHAYPHSIYGRPTVFADVAATQQNRQTGDTDADVIAAMTGQYPYMQKVPIAPGVQAIQAIMKRNNGFFISDQCPRLIEALQGGLVYKERAGVIQREYVKDDRYDHVVDAFRYAVTHLSGNAIIDTLPTQQAMSYGGTVAPMY